MSLLTKDNAVVALEIEVTEGVFVAPTGATSYVQPVLDGLEIKASKQTVSRNIATGTIGKVSSRATTSSVSASLGMEFRTASIEGDAPECDKLLMAGLGAKRQITSEVTTLTGHTASKLFIDAGDLSDFNKFDIILVKQAGAYHVSPIESIDSGAGVESITLLIPAGASFSTGVKISKVTNYSVAETHPTLSISKYIDNAIRETAAGCRVTNMSVNKFSTGGLAELSFGLEGLSFDQNVGSVPHTPTYSSAIPAILLGAKVYQNGNAIEINELTLAVENAIGFATSISSVNGKTSSRLTERTVTGSINPYKSDTDVDNFDNFKNNQAFSLFAFASNPKITSGVVVAGEFEDVIAIYLPICNATEIAQSDADGLVQESISFEATRGDGSTPEIVMAFI